MSLADKKDDLKRRQNVTLFVSKISLLTTATYT
jgi:hypothetical protein